MSGQVDFDQESPRRDYARPYSSNHPVPTVQKYREHRNEIEQHQKEATEAQADESQQSNLKHVASTVKKIFEGKGSEASIANPYPAGNRNVQGAAKEEGAHGKTDEAGERPEPPAKDGTGPARSQGGLKDPRAPDANDAVHESDRAGAESNTGQGDARQKRKDMKHMKRDDGGRVVTDPVTHLPIVVRDSTVKDLKSSPENVPTYGSEPRTYTGVSGASKETTQLDAERHETQDVHTNMEKLFPPPAFEDTKAELVRTYQFALTVGLSSIMTLVVLALVLMQLLGIRQQPPSYGGRWFDEVRQKSHRVFIPVSVTVLLSAAIGGVLITGIRGWLGKKIEETWDRGVWEGARTQETDFQESPENLPESVAWLNGLLASVWPLINPDLFASIADMLEDVMQASLPKLVRMVSVNDLGQGNEAFRILGVRWLPTGAASQTVDDKGKLKSAVQSQRNDRTASGEGKVEDSGDDNPPSADDEKDASTKDEQKKKSEEQEKEAMREGMEAEQGDFINMELAFAYRARSSGKSLKSKATNAHLYLKFYLTGSICIPVWVELKGLIGTMRLRLQLTPDPPFFNLCTLTFLGQPKANLSCVPLSKHNLNLMDVPLISGFVQSAIDAALAEYVAPKSLTLDLKDMLVGDDFKKDTTARGMVAIFIKSAKDFKDGDGGFGPIKGNSDSYVTVSWGKFGKPMASTRIIVEQQLPRWDQWVYVLVGPAELNAEERLRLQIWDSDKFTADDDLGRVEVDLKELMQSPKTKNKICDREDRLTAEDPKESMPGTISWAVGYFEKTKITEEQLKNQTEDPSIKSIADLRNAVAKTAEKKLREATLKDETKELEQQKLQDYKAREDALVISSPPDAEYPSGILSVQVHNITGLQVERLRKRQGRKDDGEHDGDSEDSDKDDVPSSYCSIILNHQKIYKTRTKPKNAKPFFNTGTERFIKDWRTSEVIVSVRDSREGENDALIGVVYLPLEKVFEKRSQMNDTFPIAGGIGFGRVRISMVFRSTQLHAPENLLGWDYGTLEVKMPIKVKSGLSDELKGCRLRLESNISKAKAYSQKNDGEWRPKRDQSVYLAVQKRYACPLAIQFRKSTLGPDSTPAFAVFWLKDIPDEVEKSITMKVWKGSKDAIKRAKSCDGYEDVVEGEQPLGEIEVDLKFWRGLSGYHKKWAESATGSGDVATVMETLDVVNDVEADGEGGDVEDSQDSSDDETEPSAQDGENEHESFTEKLKHMVGKGDEDKSNGIKSKLKSPLDSHNDPNDGSRGPMAQLRDYKDHRNELSRRHRGLMQWQGVRKLDWMSGKVRRTTHKLEGIFQHGDREPDVETEV